MNEVEKKFVSIVLEFYRQHGRSHLPWRGVDNSYHILVSELMLQQTQVDRVIPKFQLFIKRWPTMKALSKASLGEVLTIWQGLGYNRRAKFLHQCAQVVVTKHKGQLPDEYEALQSLPGIGPYTAGAILVFSKNQPIPIIETNIRTVFLHHFFSQKSTVSDKEILRFIKTTMVGQEPKIWYAALMDYGAYLKKTVGNLNQQSQAYKRQSVFKGSNREIRGAIIKVLTQQRVAVTEQQLKKMLSQFGARRVTFQLQQLITEGLVCRKSRTITLPQQNNYLVSSMSKVKNSAGIIRLAAATKSKLNGR